MASPATWPELKAEHPIIVLFRQLPEILTASEGYNEIWGVEISAPKAEASDETVEQPNFATALILQKFLRANANDNQKAFSQLKDTMVWRKSFFGADGESSKGWSDAKFDGVGYNTIIKHKKGDNKVVSWNIYGAVKDIKGTFGNLDEFIRWRVNLMESSLKLLHLENATEPIPDFGKGNDKYQSLQVHDYQNVSFLRLPSEVKTASKKTIQMFARYYPETLERKYFVNVPMIMSWVYLLMKKVVASETMKKLEMLGAGKELSGYLGEDIPEMYGGKAQPLDAGNNGVQSPKDIDGENAAKATEETEKKEEVEGEAKPEETKEEAKTEEAKTEEAKPEETAAAVATEETKTEEAKTEEAPKVEEAKTEEKVEEKVEEKSEAPIEPLPLTEETKTEAPVVTEESSKPSEVVAEPVTAEAPKETLAEVPIPAPVAVLEKPEEAVAEKKE
ncbi:Similar to Phosphatidylinositol transfer protein SFH5; acc. no. Q0V0B0 [Pyronema omphalodes CBS 100304]|uniref:Phosphatidylinositol transfer protein SFH5 n=1 Tax=Pyronema omphalodes (strain CBS 100304) TaxID=1076935 RepID=U4LTW7_PYROM|nr:Similar to Phosphatidylinositol transfer protein SFH5; acc. no. Q0V0B0 [Pyronema omphalodes CBS 100304]